MYTLFSPPLRIANAQRSAGSRIAPSFRSLLMIRFHDDVVLESIQAMAGKLLAAPAPMGHAAQRADGFLPRAKHYTTTTITQCATARRAKVSCPCGNARIKDPVVKWASFAAALPTAWSRIPGKNPETPLSNKMQSTFLRIRQRITS